MQFIQGLSGENFVDPLLQDNILLPDDFAEYNYYIGNAYEMHSIMQSGLIPGGRSNRKDRQSVFFTAVNPIDIQLDRREVEYDLDKPRIANTLGELITVQCIGAILKLAQREGLRFYSTACNYSFRHTTGDLYR